MGKPCSVHLFTALACSSPFSYGSYIDCRGSHNAPAICTPFHTWNGVPSSRSCSSKTMIRYSNASASMTVLWEGLIIRLTSGMWQASNYPILNDSGSFTDPAIPMDGSHPSNARSFAGESNPFSRSPLPSGPLPNNWILWETRCLTAEHWKP